MSFFKNNCKRVHHRHNSVFSLQNLSPIQNVVKGFSCHNKKIIKNELFWWCLYCYPLLPLLISDQKNYYSLFKSMKITQKIREPIQVNFHKKHLNQVGLRVTGKCVNLQSLFRVSFKQRAS